jgi:hypothetical protein
MISLTASFGVTTIRPDDSSVTLLARAEEALRAAKDKGRNRVELAPASSGPDADAAGAGLADAGSDGA